MTALTLAQAVAVVPDASFDESFDGDASLSINAVTADSRQAGPGVLFVAVAGTAGDGHQFIAAAEQQGATAVVVDGAWAGKIAAGTTVIRCRDTRPVPALIARALADHPDEKMWTTAVTGTNGKTTTTFLIQEMLNQLHGPCGLLGTIFYDDGRQQKKAPLTTPSGPDFYETLGRMVENGCRSVTMELSSHALDQQRTAGLGLDVALITNLGRDHLDYHANMKDYLAAKMKIRDLLRPGREGQGTGQAGIFAVNVGDESLLDLTRDLTGDLSEEGPNRLRFCADPTRDVAADLRVLSADIDLKGIQLSLIWQNETFALKSPLVGRFNVENLTAAVAVGLALGFKGSECAAALAGVQQVPGRLERFSLPSGAAAVVDHR